MNTLTRAVSILPIASGTTRKYSGSLTLTNEDGDIIKAFYTCTVTPAANMSYLEFEVTDPDGTIITYPKIEHDFTLPESDTDDVSNELEKGEDTDDGKGILEELIEACNPSDPMEYNNIFFHLLGDLVLELIQLNDAGIPNFTESIKKEYKEATIAVPLVECDITISAGLHSRFFYDEIQENEKILSLAAETGIDVLLLKKAKYSECAPWNEHCGNEECFNEYKKVLSEHNNKPKDAIILPILKTMIALYK
jgi:hypothetical protein